MCLLCVLFVSLILTLSLVSRLFIALSLARACSLSLTHLLSLLLLSLLSSALLLLSLLSSALLLDSQPLRLVCSRACLPHPFSPLPHPSTHRLSVAALPLKTKTKMLPRSPTLTSSPNDATYCNVQTRTVILDTGSSVFSIFCDPPPQKHDSNPGHIYLPHFIPFIPPKEGVAAMLQTTVRTWRQYSWSNLYGLGGGGGGGGGDEAVVWGVVALLSSVALLVSSVRVYSRRRAADARLDAVAV